MLVILWKSGPSKGYSDLLPRWWFNEDRPAMSLEHDVQGPKGGRSIARCTLKVTGSIAVLGYDGEHAEYNAGRFHPGAMKITFADAGRSKVEAVHWRDAEATGWEEIDDAESRWNDDRLDDLESFDPTDLEDGRRRINRMVVLRQGQRAFRDALMDAYGRRCAITGCTIGDILEAAHISPYLGAHTNHVTNGLLLRADIHTLFDRGVIKVDEHCRIIAPQHIKEYYGLPEKIEPPQNPMHKPNRTALAQKYRSSPG